MPGALDKGYAVVLPNQMPSSWEIMQGLQRQNELHYQQQAQLAQQEQARQAALATRLGNALDPKDYDGLLGGKIAELHKNYAQLIQQNKLTPAQLDEMIQNDLGKLSQWNQAFKMGRETIKKQAEGLKQYKGLDTGSAETVAFNNWAFKKDANGNPVLKSVEELSVPDGVVTKEVYQHPELYLTKDADIWSDLPNTPKAQKGSDYTYTDAHRGSVKRSYDYEYYSPYKTIQHDPGKDPVIIPKQVQAKGVNGEPLFLDKEKKTPFYIADEDAYKHYLSYPLRELSLRKQLKEKTNGQVDPDTPAGQTMMRRMVWEDINAMPNPKEHRSDVKKEQPIVINNSTSGSKNGEVQINDLYGELKNKAAANGGDIPLIKLSLQAQTALVNHARNLQSASITGTEKLGAEDIYVHPNSNGTFTLMRAKTKRVMNPAGDDELVTLDYKAVNTMKGVNTTSKERQKVYNTATPPAPAPASGKTIKGKSGKQIIIPS